MDVEIRPAKSLKIDTPCPSQGVFLRPEEVDALIVESQRSLSLYAMVLEDGGSQMEGFGGELHRSGSHHGGPRVPAKLGVAAETLLAGSGTGGGA